MKALMNSIVKTLTTAGVSARVGIEKGMIYIDAENDSMARDVLGMERFTGYIDGVEVVIV